MNIVLYESASRGGNFNYSRHLFAAYAKHAEVTSVSWILPSSAYVADDPGVYKILCNDQVFNRAHFLYRAFVNPLRLLRFLRSKKERHFVILNDFEQLTAGFWVPLFKMFIRRHHFSVVLHDPDRDAYPPSKSISIWSMKRLMSLMSIGMYHEYLPDKPYYKNSNTRYLDVPHGQFHVDPPNSAMLWRIQSFRGNDHLVGILGNVRMEKNYEVSIRAIAQLQGIKLVIAGSASSSSVNVDDLEKLVKELHIEDRVLFIKQYLLETEFSALIEASSVILLNYKRSFTSQSGVFNLIAPFRKNVIISDIDSGLSRIARRFGIGRLVDPDSLDDLVRELPKALAIDGDLAKRWGSYLQYASWENHVNIVIHALKHSDVQG